MSQIRPTTHDAIVEAAFQLFARNSGATLGDVAAHAGVGRATLHRHFASREDLMRALAKTAFDELTVAVDTANQDATSYSDALYRSLTAIIPLADRQLFLASDPIVNDTEIASLYAQDRQELTDLVLACTEEGLFDKTIPTAWLVESYEALVYAAWTMVRDGHTTPLQAADLAWRTLTSGLKGGR